MFITNKAQVILALFAATERKSMIKHTGTNICKLENKVS